MAAQLILTVTRACNLRCSYCPTAKDGWPELSPDQAAHAVRLFARTYGGGDIKVFGGEPLLAPHAVRAALQAAREEPAIRRISVSTNGLGLDSAWLHTFAHNPKAALTLSLDGAPEDNRRFRRVAHEGVPDAYSHIQTLLPQLLTTPRLVVTQTIAPAAAPRAAPNFLHLRSLGFHRFNLLPGYYLPWSEAQLLALDSAFDTIGAHFEAAWAAGQPLYLRNLFTRAPTPFFNTGLVVDVDGSIHPSNIGLSGALDQSRTETQVGTLSDPPSPELLAARASTIPHLLTRLLPEKVLQSTEAVDQRLTRLCRRLTPRWLASRRPGPRPAYPPPVV